MEIDPFIFRLSIFTLSIFIGYYVVWSVTPSLHTPLMSVTNAISSVIIVGAIIAALAGETENLETEGGYAKETSEEFKKKQEKLLSDTLKKIDIIICTALIPGKKAPLIIKAKMLENMQPGSVIYDLAAVQGGNVEFTEVDKIIEKNGVKIMGERNILNKLPTSSSSLYAKNVFNFVSNLYDKENKKININLEDEIIAKTIIK